MRDPERIPVILGKLQDLWENNPDYRFFQLIYSLESFAPYPDNFFTEDDIVEEVIEKFSNKLEKVRRK